MNTLNKYVVASALVLGLVFPLSTVHAATPPDVFAPPPEVLASAQRAMGSKGGFAVSTRADGTQLVSGWYKVLQTYRLIGATVTWAYLENNGWIYCNDDECERILIAAAESYHRLYVNMTSSSTFNSVTLYKY
ncbi:MAG: hypothetical protein E6Q83_16200 [Thiothrix sp.]|nr:MAG: hypothetical protein E6Q83_16200 [Thiothrix sp.]